MDYHISDRSWRAPVATFQCVARTKHRRSAKDVQGRWNFDVFLNVFEPGGPGSLGMESSLTIPSRSTIPEQARERLPLVPVRVRSPPRSSRAIGACNLTGTEQDVSAPCHEHFTSGVCSIRVRTCRNLLSSRARRRIRSPQAKSPTRTKPRARRSLPAPGR